MKIGIIGAGSIGGTLVHKLRASGHEVRVANSRGPESLRSLEAETGATAVTAAEVAAGVDALIVSAPFQQLAALTLCLPLSRPNLAASFAVPVSEPLDHTASAKYQRPA